MEHHNDFNDYFQRFKKVCFSCGISYESDIWKCLFSLYKWLYRTVRRGFWADLISKFHEFFDILLSKKGVVAKLLHNKCNINILTQIYRFHSLSLKIDSMIARYNIVFTWKLVIRLKYIIHSKYTYWVILINSFQTNSSYLSYVASKPSSDNHRNIICLQLFSWLLRYFSC
jgi:hypothetical protein